MVRDCHIEVAPGVRLRARVRDEGDGGVPHLLVHGLASNALMWEGVGDALAARGHTVVAIDQRGHGRSSKPDDGYDFATLSDDLLAVIDGLRLDRPVVAGQSWGANVALELAARHAERVRGVVCVDGGMGSLQTRFPSWDDCAEVLRPPPLTGTPLVDMERMMRTAHRDWPESGIAGLLACFEVREDGTIAPWLTLARHVTILRELWAHDVTGLHRRVAVPVLLAPARHANRADVEAAERALAHARTRWFDADHDVHAQCPEELAAFIDDGFIV